MLQRRDFLRLLLASAVADAVDVERLLWVPTPTVTVPAMPIGIASGGIKEYLTLDQELTRITLRYFHGIRPMDLNVIFPVVRA